MENQKAANLFGFKRNVWSHHTEIQAYKWYKHRLKLIWSSNPNYEKLKKSFKKSPPNISPHSNLPLDFWAGGEFWRDIRGTFLKSFFEFLVIWIRSSNSFEVLLYRLKSLYLSVVWSNIPFEFKEINSEPWIFLVPPILVK
jgi:hypothetical protein